MESLVVQYYDETIQNEDINVSHLNYDGTLYEITETHNKGVTSEKLCFPRPC